MPSLLRTIISLVIFVGTLAVLSVYVLRWRVGRTSGTELLGQVGVSVVLAGASTALLAGLV